eukprot:13324148-Alexandrium_andersonii.AAC.1
MALVSGCRWTAVEVGRATRSIAAKLNSSGTIQSVGAWCGPAFHSAVLAAQERRVRPPLECSTRLADAGNTRLSSPWQHRHA